MSNTSTSQVAQAIRRTIATVSAHNPQPALKISIFRFVLIVSILHNKGYTLYQGTRSRDLSRPPHRRFVQRQRFLTRPAGPRSQQEAQPEEKGRKLEEDGREGGVRCRFSMTALPYLQLRVDRRLGPANPICKL
jgi:hypothetical protein